MYNPRPNQVQDESRIREMVQSVGSAWFVTSDADGLPQATLVPVLWRGDTVVAHLAKANPHWRSFEDGSPALLIVSGAEAYVSPSWYASKAEHGRVVPTWNYSAVHLVGTVRTHQDPQWLRTAVGDLTDAHESARDDPWQVDDAPEAFVAGQVRGIVGIEITVTQVEGKAKLSQNRSDDDRHGVIEGLRADGRGGAHVVADQMDAAGLD